MEGLAALERIMKDHPLPVLMVSSSTLEGADITLRALEVGAMDFVAKNAPHGGLDVLKIEGELVRKVRAIAHQRVRRPPFLALPPSPRRGPRTAREVDLVVIGASTGGPPALQALVGALPGDFPCGVVVVQHMPPGFTASLAERLDSLSALTIREAASHDRIEPGHVLVAPGGWHLLLRQAGRAMEVELAEEPRDTLHRPSVDVTFASAAQLHGRRALAVVLTGMGSDGLEGVRAIKAAGGKAFVQDEESCVVYGMPRAVAEAGLADAVVPLAGLPQEILHAL
jgi:two-component system chemotaxis response regulator CheB